MARRTCPTCKKVVEEKLEKEGNKVTKSCPECGFIFVSYVKGKGYTIFNSVEISENRTSSN
ncbi:MULTISPECIES: hypothetical protein [Acidianus]|uniref:Uncharacterized protein n=1 Tax=Candidatus Acidianus copahuensis TaxID=1160895 RepID=A0A031LTP0_9CREN|nr:MULTISPECIES: hypothetical protein [Acidianus]EZQ11090.1 hypothetical protein CM19_02520 [Candidatus Acidianus copahuensis]NON62434.1 hypothetical protein [Acidianus sp. RZ1]